MPKKFVGENSKSAAAKARKEAVKTDHEERVSKAKEDAYWADDDKLAQKKQQRKEEQEQKRQQALEKKNLSKQAYEEEMNQLASSSSKAPPSKLTQATINARKHAELVERVDNQKQQLLAAKKIEVPKEEIEENLNRSNLDRLVASNVDEAIKVLSTDETAASVIDRHPEKRVKAAYAAFEERKLPELKKSHPTFRMSQLKQLLKKEWQKSTENPLNQNILNIVK